MIKTKAKSLKVALVIFSAAVVLVGCQSPAKEKTKGESISKSERLVQEVKPGDFFVDTDWAKAAIDKKERVVIEASYGEGASYKKEHLPDAIHMDTMSIESEDSHWNIFDFKESAKAFTDKGVTKDSKVLVYSEDINAAARVAFVAYWLGVKDVKLLDGGLAEWKKADLPLEKGVTQVKAVKEFGTDKPGRPECLITSPEDLKKARKENPKFVLASVRSWDEFIGKTSGYTYIENAGEPEGAVYALSSKSSADVAYLVNTDGTIKEPSDIFKEWEEWGITPDKEVAFYCGTGWRAATAFFICQQEGWKDVKMYDGGWFDWDISHQKAPSEYPVQIGDPHDEKNFKIVK